MNRQELQNATSISRLQNRNDRSSCSVIGTVLEKTNTSKNDVMLTVEDQTGKIKVFIGKNRPDIFSIAKEIVLDEVIGVAGTPGQCAARASPFSLRRASRRLRSGGGRSRR